MESNIADLDERVTALEAWVAEQSRLNFVLFILGFLVGTICALIFI